MAHSNYPATRMRRVRQFDWTRRMVSENRLSVDDLIWPVFVQSGQNRSTPVVSMPGVFRMSIDVLVSAVRTACELGIPAIAVFPETDPDKKTENADEAVNPNNLICESVRAIKSAVPGMGIICDVALDPYTSHGHDGLVRDGMVVNDESVDRLCQQAIVQADAGCDIIAPSDMMDGRVGRIRSALDQHGFENVMIMSYAAKYASGFYDPFREAIGSQSNLAANKLGADGKKTYQMNPANADEAMREVQLDINEGADMIMVKPGMPYLDVIHRVKSTFGIPTFAYQVSGEYSMIMAAVENGWLERDVVMMESLVGFKRAGCDGILTYFAIEAAKLMMAQH